MRYFGFSLLLGGFAVLVHLYLYRRLVLQVTFRRAVRRALGSLLVLMTVLLLFRRPIQAMSPDIEALHQRVAYTWLGLALCLLVLLATYDGVRALVRSSVRLRPLFSLDTTRTSNANLPPKRPSESHAPQIDLERRRFVAQSVHVGIAAAGTLATGYGAFRAFAPPEITETVIQLPRLPRALDGLSVVQLTDIHVGAFIDDRFIGRLVEATNELKPDLVAITGDLVDGDVPTLGPAVARLGRLRSRYGTFFVTGNHEYYSGETEWCRFLERLGVTVLRNRRVSIGDAGGSLDLVGVDDFSAGRWRNRPGYDLDAALAGRDPERAAVLLAHQPTNFEVAAARGMNLQLSGHTHGGQVFPMTVLVGLGWKYSRGLYRYGESHIYVSRGCGFWGPPARIGSPPEIARLVLTA